MNKIMEAAVAQSRREWIECVAKCAERTSGKFQEYHDNENGLEQIIYGEMRDAFQIFANELRAEQSEATKQT